MNGPPQGGGVVGHFKYNKQLSIKFKILGLFSETTHPLGGTVPDLQRSGSENLTAPLLFSGQRPRR